MAPSIIMAAATKAGPGKHRPTATSITDTEGGSETAGASQGRTVALEQSLELAVLAIISVLGTWPPALYGGRGLPDGLSILGGSASDATLVAVAAALTRT